MLDRCDLVDNVYNDGFGAVGVAAELSDGAVQTYYGRKTCGEMQVRAAKLSCLVQNTVDVHDVIITFHFKLSFK